MNTDKKSNDGSVTFITLDELFSDKITPNTVSKSSLQTNQVDRITSYCIECDTQLDDFIITSYSNCEHYCYNHCIAKLKKLLINLQLGCRVCDARRIFDIVITNMSSFKNVTSFLKTIINKVFDLLYNDSNQSKEMQEFRTYLHGWLEIFVAILPRETIVASLGDTTTIQIRTYFGFDKA